MNENDYGFRVPSSVMFKRRPARARCYLCSEPEVCSLCSRCGRALCVTHYEVRVPPTASNILRSVKMIWAVCRGRGNADTPMPNSSTPAYEQFTDYRYFCRDCVPAGTVGDAEMTA